MIQRECAQLGQREIHFETGKVAKQAGGSVVVRCEDTMVLVTAVASSYTRPVDFVPLTCEYQERGYAAGRIPGSFFRREGRPYEWEVLTCRLMDRPSRPLFPKAWRFDTQVIATVLSFDHDNAPDVLAITGASAALHMSDIPWDGPIAGVRVGQVDGTFVANPSREERDASPLDLVVAASRDAIVMVEGRAAQVPEPVLLDALMFGKESAQPLLDCIEALREGSGKAKRAFDVPVLDPSVIEAARQAAVAAGLDDALETADKLARYARFDEVKARVLERLCGTEEAPGELAGREKEVGDAFSAVKKTRMRGMILDDGRRIGGRAFDEVRDIAVEVGVVPRAHGSALFTRGETQAVVTATLGTRKDEQRIDSIEGDSFDPFMLHYFFPPYCVGESRMLRGVSRREIGHGTLAKRAVAGLLPDREEFPYTLRIASEILESNGSSSMATVCGASLAMFDAGIPITTPIAGVAMGLVADADGDRLAILTDILGDEDHLGDMDFKVCGTQEGVTALQMDIKIAGLSRDVLQRALAQAQEARLHILGEMNKVIERPRDDLSPYAPRITLIKVHPDRIRDIIGPGGKTIRGIVEQTDCTIDVADDGTVSIASPDEAAKARAIEIIEGLTALPELNRIYVGTVVKLAEFGAFCEILPGTDGLLHISEISDRHTRRVEDVLQEGDEVTVKVINIDSQSGKIKLSRREAMADLARMAEEEAPAEEDAPEVDEDAPEVDEDAPEDDEDAPEDDEDAPEDDEDAPADEDTPA